MAKDPTLTPAQSEVVRRFVLDLLRSATQGEIADSVELAQQTISRIAGGKHLVGVGAAIKIAQKYPELDLSGILSGTVVDHDVDEPIPTPPSSLPEISEKRKIAAISSRLGVSPALVVVLTDDARRASAEAGMGNLPEKVLSACWGVVHVRSVSVEVAMKEARDLYDGLGEERDTDALDAKWFLDRLAERLSGHPFKGSGTFPAPVAKTQARTDRRRRLK